MPSEETRHLLRTFGVAVTNFEDMVDRGASSEEVAQAEVEVGKRMQAIAALIAALRAKKLRLAFGSVS
jgi:hypothetical protein